MKTVKVYGPGGAQTEAMVRAAAARLDVAVAVEVEKVTDATSITMAGEMSTPGVAVDGTLVPAGRPADAAGRDAWRAA